MKKYVHIGIVTYNSLHDLPLCLVSVHDQEYPYIRLTILDNASIDGTREWLEEHLPEESRILNAQNEGFARGHNQIISQVDPDAHYLALNPDVILQRGYVQGLVAVCTRRHAGWAVGKLFLNQEVAPRLYSVGHAILRDGYAFNIGYGDLDAGQFDNEREIFGAPGAAVLYTSTFRKKMGSPLFDADFFVYGEDVDLDWRAQLRGLSCWYSPDAVAYHRGSHLSSDLIAIALANRMLSAIKNACLVHLVCIIIPGIFLHLLLRLLVTPKIGIIIARRVSIYAPKMWQKREPVAKDKCSKMMEWFQWGSEQPGLHPSYKERLKAFWYRR